MSAQSGSGKGSNGVGVHSSHMGLRVLRRTRSSWPEILRQGRFGRGSSLAVWTTGQGGTLDLVDALLRVIDGPAGLELSIWSGEGADVRAVEAWVRRARLTRARWVVDRSFEGRDPKLAGILQSRFPGSIEAAGRLHFKAILLTSADWTIAALTSASLDPASRLEHWVISDDPGFVGIVGDALDAAVAGDPMPEAVVTRAGTVGFSNPGVDSIDFLRGFVDDAPGGDLTIGVWTCSVAHLARVRHWLDEGLVGSVRWLVDASMVRGTPRAALQALRDQFGDDAIRGCSLHGKFWRYGDLTCLTSANLNANPRAESYVFAVSADLGAATDALVDLVWERQKPGAAWLRGRGLRVNRAIRGRGSG